MRPFVKIMVIAVLALICGCVGPQTQTRVEPSRTDWIGYMFYSDPPGAHLYGENGEYWGQTSEDEPVRRVFYGTAGDSRNYTVTAKKRGYKTTHHSWWLKYRYASQTEAESNYEKMVILLDSE